MSRVALTLAAVFALQGPLCVLHCLGGPSRAEASAALPPCHAQPADDPGQAPAPEPGEAPLERCAQLGQVLAPEGSTLDLRGGAVFALPAADAPLVLLVPAPLLHAPPSREPRERLYLATSQLRL